ncbi:MAG: hypothetical protein Q9164_006888, partial [Protoblastenia rupestris]
MSHTLQNSTVRIKDTSTTPETAPSAILIEHRKDPPKSRPNGNYLDVPLQPAFVRVSDASSDDSLYAADNDNERRMGRPPNISPDGRLSSTSPAPSPTWKDKAVRFWTKNKGLALVCLAQLFGVMMNVTTRLLEMNGKHGPGMHPFEILFARMTGTLVLSGTYQWLAKVEHAPFGPRGVWLLLVTRGVGGFFG